MALLLGQLVTGAAMLIASASIVGALLGGALGRYLMRRRHVERLALGSAANDNAPTDKRRRRRRQLALATKPANDNAASTDDVRHFTHRDHRNRRIVITETSPS